METRRILTLDGGGIRGVLTIEVLAKIEELLQKEKGIGVLADYFDYIAGTSTGAILAACLSKGMSVDQIRSFYHTEGERMFSRAPLLRKYRYSYDAAPLEAELRKQFGHMTLGSGDLQTFLLLVLRNATTDSPWPLSNNPNAKYNDAKRPDCNLLLPLWQLVRASTAAPAYFPPEFVELAGKEFAFVDGGVTVYNNPAFLAFLMATLPPYSLNWPTGANRMLIVSVGTGREPVLRPDLSSVGETLIGHALTVPFALMSSAAAEQDLLCRAFGRCLCGDMLDRELGDLVDASQVCADSASQPNKLFTYVRYDVELTTHGVARVGCDVDPVPLRKLDAVDRISDLARLGSAVAKARVEAAHFAGFPRRTDSVGPNHDANFDATAKARAHAGST